MVKRPEITGLRGIAATLVVVFHAFLLWGKPIPGGIAGIPHTLARDGWIGVNLFFVLSGFLLAYPLVTKPELLRTRLFWGAYYVKRWARIVPPYYAALAFALVIRRHLGMERTAAWDFWSHVFFIHSFTFPEVQSIVPVFWTLAVEFQFYLLLPLLVIPFTGRRWRTATIGYPAISLAWLAATYDSEDLVHVFWGGLQLPANLGQFGLGMAVARAQVEWNPTWRAQGRWPLLTVGALLATLATTMRAPGEVAWELEAWPRALVPQLVGLECALLVWFVTVPSRFQSLLSMRWLERLGEMSYSLYLTHVPVAWGMLYYWPDSRTLPFEAFVVTFLVGAIVFAALFYVVIERPALTLKDRLAARLMGTRREPGARRDLSDMAAP